MDIADNPAPAAPPSPELAALDPDRAAAGDGAGVSDQGPPAAGASSSEGLRAGAVGFAALVVNILAGAVVRQYPAAVYTDEEKAAASAVLAPVLLKHGLTAAWAAKWQEEIAAGLVFAGLAYAGFQRVQAARSPAAGASQPAASP